MNELKIIVSGPAGSGKTEVSAFIAKELLSKGFIVEFLVSDQHASTIEELAKNLDDIDKNTLIKVETLQTNRLPEVDESIFINIKDFIPIEGSRCPNCNKYSDTNTFIQRSKKELKLLPKPHYIWIEYHQCTCGERYQFVDQT